MTKPPSSLPQTFCYHAVTLDQQLWLEAQNRLAAGKVAAKVGAPPGGVPLHRAHEDPMSGRQPCCAPVSCGASLRTEGRHFHVLLRIITILGVCIPHFMHCGINDVLWHLVIIIIIIIIIISQLSMCKMGIVRQGFGTDSVSNLRHHSDPILDGNPQPFPSPETSALLTLPLHPVQSGLHRCSQETWAPWASSHLSMMVAMATLRWRPFLQKGVR